MTLDQLRVFLAVADRLHVTRAAEALNMTQSAVSASLSALERHHNVKLFDRIGRRIALTDIGTALIPEARAVLNQAEVARLTLEDFAQEPRGRLRLYASQTVASYWLPQHILALHKAYPGIDLSLNVGNTTQVAQAVLEGAADLGFVEGAVSHAELHQQVVARDRLLVAVSCGHPWSGKRSVPVSEYLTQKWILREEGSGTRSAFEEALQKHGLSLNKLDIAFCLPSNEACLAAVAAGEYVTALSEKAISHAQQAGIISEVLIPGAERPFAVLTHPARHRTRAVSAMLALVSK